MTHAGATQSPLLLDVPLYHKKHPPHFMYATQIVVVAQGGVYRFTNNNVVPLKYRESDKDHVQNTQNHADSLGLSAIFPNLPIMLAWHDASEPYGEPKTVNGVLFKGLEKADLPEFERLAFETVAIDAAISVAKHTQQQSVSAEKKFLARINKDKARMEKHSVFYKGNQPPEHLTPLLEMIDINQRAHKRLEAPWANGDKQKAQEIVADATAYYAAYSCPQRRQTDPMVATAKFLDSYEGIKQLHAVATEVCYNTPKSKKYALLDKAQKYNKEGGLPVAFLQSADVLLDAQNFTQKINTFREVMSQNLPDASDVIKNATIEAYTLGANFLLHSKPFYSFGIAEPALHNSPKKHIEHYRKIVAGRYSNNVFSASQIANAFLNGVDVTNYDQVSDFISCSNSPKVP